MTTIPKTHRGLTVKADPLGCHIIEKPLPTVEDDEILVKVGAVTLNPADHKHVWGWGVLTGGESMGCDFAGDVVYVGPKAQAKGLVQVGDRVGGLIRGGIPVKDNGSFQEYLKTVPELVWKLPKEISYEHGAAMGGISLCTAVQSLYHRLLLPPPYASEKPPTQIVIWGGATSVGIYAIKLAKLSGLRVATTASPKNHPMLKELGAELTIDYRDPEAPKKIKEWGGGKIVHAVDTISDQGSTKLTAQCLSNEGGEIVLMHPVSREGIPDNVKFHDEFIYAMLDRTSDDFDLVSQWYQRLPDYASELTVMPLKSWPGGLDGVPEALEYLKAGKASGEKVAVRY